MKPSFTLFVYWFAFTVGLRGGNTETFGGVTVTKFIFMLAGFVPWFFIQESILQGSRCIRNNRQYVTKVNFPVSTIITFTSLSRLYIHLALSVIMYVILLLTPGVGASVYNLQFFLYMPLMFFFFVFLTWSLAPMCAFSADFQNAINSFMSGVFWLSGIIYNSYDPELPAIIGKIMYLNPINFFVNGYRNAFIWQRPFYADTIELAVFLVEFALVFVFGVLNYNRLRKRLPDVL